MYINKLLFFVFIRESNTRIENCRTRIKNHKYLFWTMQTSSRFWWIVKKPFYLRYMLLGADIVSNFSLNGINYRGWSPTAKLLNTMPMQINSLVLNWGSKDSQPSFFSPQEKRVLVLQYNIMEVVKLMVYKIRIIIFLTKFKFKINNIS